MKNSKHRILIEKHKNSTKRRTFSTSIGIFSQTITVTNSPSSSSYASYKILRFYTLTDIIEKVQKRIKKNGRQGRSFSSKARRGPRRV